MPESQPVETITSSVSRAIYSPVEKLIPWLRDCNGGVGVMLQDLILTVLLNTFPKLLLRVGRGESVNNDQFVGFFRISLYGREAFAGVV